MKPDELENLIPKSPFDGEHLPLSEHNFKKAMKIKEENQKTVFPHKTISFLCEIIEWQRQYIKNIKNR